MTTQTSQPGIALGLLTVVMLAAIALDAAGINVAGSIGM